jgi:hypothetical protein
MQRGMARTRLSRRRTATIPYGRSLGVASLLVQGHFDYLSYTDRRMMNKKNVLILSLQINKISKNEPMNFMKKKT